MTDRNYHTYEERIALEKSEREQRKSIARGILAILLALFIIWFIFGFLGSFFVKSPERTSHYGTTESSQTTSHPKKDLTSPVPHAYKGTISPLPHEQNFSEEKV
ncbi:ABC-type Fe3+ transport system permease subunit [Bartonella silvatica]|uniref:ABC-type Fe3+ transport system permease subunit n=1 Tax=Bartonella silvatica TaxID=357760 RepID=A0ABV2HHW7_9HYPH